MAEDVRAEVVLGGRVLEHAGLSDMVWGHVSARPGGPRRLDEDERVHVHDALRVHAVALAASDVELRAFSHIGGVFSGGVQRYHDAAGLVTTAEEGAAPAAALGEDRALLLVGRACAVRLRAHAVRRLPALRVGVDGPPSLSSGRWRRKSRCGSTGARRR